MQSYKDLIVWQKSMELVVEIYLLTESFPKSEQYGLVSQMRRCVVSMPSNIAEGSRRSGKRDSRQFFIISFASGAELETQIEICKRLPGLNQLNYLKAEQLLSEVMKMLNKLTRHFDG